MAGLGLRDDEVLYQLLEHVARTEYVGLDPSTVTYNPNLVRIAELARSVPLVSRVWRSLCHRTVFYLGHRTHKLLAPPACRFTKGLALCLSACAHLYSGASGGTLTPALSLGGRGSGTLTPALSLGGRGGALSEQERERIRAQAIYLESLIAAKRLPQRDLWAHDWDYEIEGVPVTTQTPNLVTTAFVAQAYWDWWSVTGGRAYLERFLSIVEAMLEALPMVEHDGAGCFMYTPVTQYHVHNANLLMAELVARRYTHTADPGDMALIERAVRYSLQDFERTNSFPYAGPPTENAVVDNYHTGYVLRSLHTIARCVPDLSDRLGIWDIVRRGVGFYIARFVRKGRVWFGLHRMTETHSLAESILIHKVFSPIMTDGQKESLLSAIRLTARELKSSKGDFFINNRKYLPFGLGCISDRTDMVRWSQAWMIYALAYKWQSPKPKAQNSGGG